MIIYLPQALGKKIGNKNVSLEKKNWEGGVVGSVGNNTKINMVELSS